MRTDDIRNVRGTCPFCGFSYPVGTLIRGIREHRKIPRTVLARATGVSASTLYRLETNQNATMRTLARVLLALGMEAHPSLKPINDEAPNG